MNQIVRVSDPRISSDGKSIVVVVERADPETNRWNAELVLVDTAKHIVMDASPSQQECVPKGMTY